MVIYGKKLLDFLADYLVDKVENSVKKHFFNTIFFGVLAIPTIIWAVKGSVTLISHYLNPPILADNVIQSSYSLPLVIMAIFIHLILPIIFTITFIFHILAFYKCDLSIKKFNAEFIINVILAFIGIVSLILLWLIGKSNTPEAGMIFALPAVIWVITLICSMVIFYTGYSLSHRSA